jgi:hypothetical protein
MSSRRAAGEPAVFMWDVREQPPMEDIAMHVNAAMFTGGTFMYVVPNTWTDSYAVVLSPVELNLAEVQRAFEERP